MPHVREFLFLNVLILFIDYLVFELLVVEIS
jgi:hypothetical protein